MKLVKKINWPKVLLILIIVLLAYGQTLLMYFWQDDSALIFKLMNPVGQAGSFGKGIIGNGPYKYLVTPFVPFFPIFGKEPVGYFAIGIVTYVIAAWAFYFFAKNLFKEKKAAYFATLIFSAGYVGGDTMFRVINSWQTNIGLVLALVTFGLYAKYLNNGKIRYYLLSFISFWTSVEFIFIRSHSLVFAIIALDFVFSLIPLVKRKIPGFVARLIPFVLVFHKYYMTDGSFSATGENSIIKKILIDHKYYSLSSYFADLGNVLIPNVVQTRILNFVTKAFLSHELLDSQVLWISIATLVFCTVLVVLIKKVYRLNSRSFIITFVCLIGAFALNNYFFEQFPIWYRSIQTIFSGGLALSFSVVLIYLTVGLWKVNKNLSRVLLVGLSIAATQYSAYFVQYQTSVFATNHRYFSHSIIGTSIVFGIIGYLSIRKQMNSKIPAKGYSFQRLIGKLPILIIILTYLILDIVMQRKIVLDRSRPSRAFYQDLRKYTPEINSGSAFYFDVAQNMNARSQFGDFFSVGSMPDSTALAIYYDVDRNDVIRLIDFDELVYNLSTGKINLSDTYSFWVKGYDFRSGDLDGLVYTTDELRKGLLEKGRKISLLEKPVSFSSDYKVKDNVTYTSDLVVRINSSISSVTPQLLTIRANLSPALAPSIFPFKYGEEKNDLNSSQKMKALSYLVSRANFFNEVKAESTSEWKYREIRNVVDNDDSTVWQGHRIWWHDNSVEDVTLDLGSEKTINKFIWKNWKTVLAPISYEIQMSKDKLTWQTVKKVENGPERKSGELVVEQFPNSIARYIRMHITKVQTADSPGLMGVEVVESKYSEVDPLKAQLLSNSPFFEITNLSEWNSIYKVFSPLTTLEVSYKSNESGTFSDPISVLVNLDGKTHNYEAILPAGGTDISNINISFKYPVQGRFESIISQNLTLSELEERGLIKTFNEN